MEMNTAESIREIVGLEKNPGFAGPEVGPAATGISGPRDKELNFPLVLYLRGRGENDGVSAWSWSREMSHADHSDE